MMALHFEAEELMESDPFGVDDFEIPGLHKDIRENAPAPHLSFTFLIAHNEM